jgi:pilus assembly protein Flp/PilA
MKISLTNVLNFLVRVSSERGQTMAEYGILIAVIAVVVVVAATELGGSITGIFHNASAKL